MIFPSRSVQTDGLDHTVNAPLWLSVLNGPPLDIGIDEAEKDIHLSIGEGLVALSHDRHVFLRHR
jgi:hypothetical protein